MVSEDAQQLIRNTIARVDTKRDYNIAQMERDTLFPWIKDRRSYRKAVMLDARGPNILQAKITGEGRGRDYSINGAHIKTYLKTLGYAMVLTNAHIHGTKPADAQDGSGERQKRSIRGNRRKNR